MGTKHLSQVFLDQPLGLIQEDGHNCGVVVCVMLAHFIEVLSTQDLTWKEVTTKGFTRYDVGQKQAIGVMLDTSAYPFGKNWWRHLMSNEEQGISDYLRKARCDIFSLFDEIAQMKFVWKSLATIDSGKDLIKAFAELIDFFRELDHRR